MELKIIETKGDYVTYAKKVQTNAQSEAIQKTINDMQKEILDKGYIIWKMELQDLIADFGKRIIILASREKLIK